MTTIFEDKGFDEYNINQLSLTVINSTLKFYAVEQAQKIVDLDIVLEHGNFIRNIIIEISERLQNETNISSKECLSIINALNAFLKFEQVKL